MEPKQLLELFQDLGLLPRSAEGLVEDREVLMLALALNEVALSIRYLARELGTNDAATRLGALELLAKEVRDGTRTISAALECIANVR